VEAQPEAGAGGFGTPGLRWKWVNCSATKIGYKELTIVEISWGYTQFVFLIFLNI
jgi:hypothetical protein